MSTSALRGVPSRAMMLARSCPFCDAEPGAICTNRDGSYREPWDLHMIRGLDIDVFAENAKRANPVTHCKRGHEYNEANTYMRGAYKDCRACRAYRQKANYVPKRKAAA